MCSNAPRAINNWPSSLFMFIELKNTCGWRHWYIHAWAWDAHIINCNQFNPQISWYKQLLKPVVNIKTSLLFCVWLLRETRRGNGMATSQKTEHEPECIKSNLSEEEIQPGQWSQRLWSSPRLFYREHAGICLQLFIQQQFNRPLWTHHTFCLGLVVTHFLRELYPASKKIECCGPPLCRIDSSFWSAVLWPAIVLKGPLLPA